MFFFAKILDKQTIFFEKLKKMQASPKAHIGMGSGHTFYSQFSSGLF
jgi:hypothetical protein